MALFKGFSKWPNKKRGLISRQKTCGVLTSLTPPTATAHACSVAVPIMHRNIPRNKSRTGKAGVFREIVYVAHYHLAVYASRTSICREPAHDSMITWGGVCSTASVRPRAFSAWPRSHAPPSHRTLAPLGDPGAARTLGHNARPGVHLSRNRGTGPPCK